MHKLNQVHGGDFWCRISYVFDILNRNYKPAVFTEMNFNVATVIMCSLWGEKI